MVVVVALERGLLLLNLLSIVIPGLYLGWLATSLFVSRTFFFFKETSMSGKHFIFSLWEMLPFGSKVWWEPIQQTTSSIA